MAHKTIFNVETGIIETKYQGIVAFNEVKEVVSESTTLSKESKCYLWLADFSEATLNLSTMEIYDLPKLILEAGTLLNIAAFHIKRAIVIIRDKANYEFAETVSKNRGQNIDLFDDIGNARKWLKNELFYKTGFVSESSPIYYSCKILSCWQ